MTWLVSSRGTAQTFVKTLQLTGGDTYPIGYGEMKMTADSGAIFINQINSPFDYYLVKLDKTATFKWSASYQQSGVTIYEYDVRQTPDGGYIVAGTYNSNGLLVKTDATGTIQWSKTYAIVSTLNFTSIDVTIDSGYIVGGYYGGDYYVLRTDVGGNVLWSYSYAQSGAGGEYVSWVQQTSDGGYAFVGTIPSNVGQAKLDASGNVQWYNRYGTSITNGPPHIIESSAGGYLVCASQLSGFVDVLLIKTSPNGTVQWQNRYGTTAGLDGVYGILEAPGPSFVAFGYHNGQTGGGNVSILKVDTFGAMQSLRNVGVSNPPTTVSESPKAGAALLPNGGYFIIGEASVSGLKTLAIQTDANGDVNGLCKETPPNIVTTTSTITVTNPTLVANTLTTTASSVTLTKTSYTLSSNDYCPVILPVELLLFTADTVNGGVELNWETAGNCSLSEFVVERSVSTSFEPVGSVENDQCERSITKQIFIDEHPEEGNNYYRLKVMEADGDFSYSPIARVNVRSESPLNIAPNPFSDELLIEVPEGSQALEILTSSGVPIHSETLWPDRHGSGAAVINSAAWPAGLYSIRLVSSNGSVSNRLVVKTAR